LSVLKIACLGPLGSWTCEVADGYAKRIPSASLAPQKNVSDVFLSLTSLESELGVVAIENNVEGFVNEVLDLLHDNLDLIICDLVWKDIKFDAVSIPGIFNDGELRGSVLGGHPHALAQCKNFVSEFDLLQQSYPSNSRAALDLKDNPGVKKLALVPHNSEEFADLDVVKQDVQDFDKARTAFVLLKHLDYDSEFTNGSEQDHNRAFYEITPRFEDRPGTLLQILQTISDANINISSLISRPVKGVDHKYSFYLILDGEPADTEKHLNKLIIKDCEIRLLGTWYESK
jgi:prephenate dehydratase